MTTNRRLQKGRRGISNITSSMTPAGDSAAFVSSFGINGLGKRTWSTVSCALVLEGRISIPTARDAPILPDCIDLFGLCICPVDWPRGFGLAGVDLTPEWLLFGGALDWEVGRLHHAPDSEFRGFACFFFFPFLISSSTFAEFHVPRATTEWSRTSVMHP